MQKYYNNILCVGDSHASKSYTQKSWPYWISGVKETLSSPGAGIEIGVQKLALKLSQDKFDFVIFQTSHNMRLSAGMNYNGKNDTTKELDWRWEDHGCKVDNHFIMGLNRENNVKAMRKYHGIRKTEFYNGFNKWYLKYQGDNEYETKIKYLQHICSVQQLCKAYDIPCAIFNWHTLPQSQSKLYSAWNKVIDHSCIVSTSVEQWYIDTDFDLGKNTVDGYHLTEEGSRLLVQDYLEPAIFK